MLNVDRPAPEPVGDFVSRENIGDGIISLAELQADPLWEQDDVTDCWHRRTPEFFTAQAAVREALVRQQKDAEIALAAALIGLEADLPPQVDGGVSAWAPDGTHYVVIASAEHCKGEEMKRCRTSAEAIANWKRALLEYAATHTGDVLWWRYRPEIRGDVPFGRTEAAWIVYSRLAIGTPFIEQVRRGEAVPNCWDVESHRITMDQLADLGLVFDVSTGLFRKPAMKAAAAA